MGKKIQVDKWGTPENNNKAFKKYFFWCAPIGYLHFHSFQSSNEPGLDGVLPGL